MLVEAEICMRVDADICSRVEAEICRGVDTEICTRLDAEICMIVAERPEIGANTKPTSMCVSRLQPNHQVLTGMI